MQFSSKMLCVATLVLASAVALSTAAFMPTGVCGGRKSPVSSGDVSAFIDVWVKHDRSSSEVRHINITAGASPNEIQGTYLDSVLAGKNTWNVTLCGDFLSGTGFYNNFNEDMSQACPTPFGLILSPDANVIYVAYGRADATSPCGEYDGDSAAYYRSAC